MAGPFALPVPAWRLGQQSQRKRKRNEETQPERSPSPEADNTPTPSHLPSDSINPLSHSPSTLRQFAVAGLSPEEEVPSKIYPGFPHKSLPPDWRSGDSRGRRSRTRSRSRMSAIGSGSEADVDTDASESHRRKEEDVLTSSSARIKHLNTMVAILHRCLHAGDITRAKRAFSLLIRTKDVDIRLNEMWTIGTEILMRDGEEQRREEASRLEQGSTGVEDEDRSDPTSKSPARWGSASNIDKVRSYLEGLIQQHPYDPHLTRLTSAVDFWPALFSIEIYNIDAECRRALHRLDQQSESAAADDDNDSEPPPLSPGSEEDPESQIQRREHGRREVHWAGRDEVRSEAQTAAQQIAARMDQLMENAPYATHVELLRLRGMLALWLGDLYLSSRFLDTNGLEDRLQGLSLSGTVHRDVSDRDRDALRQRADELEKARCFFERLMEKGGELEPWLLKFVDPDDERDGDVSSLLS
ncbi:hypothetical protein JX265_011091 [Neoarthrinium moseri]|uniref:Uncharacterized protein n=1 Tax=Neoarthrinium moseri TaxID=1658444 RepID=A0A9P9WD10_9PEZI|nr:hypothetical protein JX265_011091 [Neoarthrinium moseri]